MKNKLKQFFPLVFMTLGLAVASSNLHAENRLFPTDILNQEEVDARLSITHSTLSGNIRNSSGNFGNQSSESVSESAQIRYGLGDNWHVGAGLQYRSRAVTTTDFSNPPAHFANTSLEGNQNPTLWATYGFINDKTSPLSVNGELLVSPNTTGKRGTSYTGRISTGWKSSDTLKLYGAFSASTTRDATTPNMNRIIVGAFKDISDQMTLIPHISYTRSSETDFLYPVTQHAVGLSSDILIAPDTYLIPDIVFHRIGAVDSKNGFSHGDPINNGRTLTLELYHLL